MSCPEQVDYSLASRQQLYILSAYLQMYRHKVERNYGLTVVMRTSGSIWNIYCLLHCSPLLHIWPFHCLAQLLYGSKIKF